MIKTVDIAIRSRTSYRLKKASLNTGSQQNRREIIQIICLSGVRKNDLRFGHRVVVNTCNSTYSIHVLKNEQYAISGGWVDKEGLSPMTTNINGCAWGGSAIKVDIVAACGLHLEFGNRVVTSRIKEFDVVRLGTDSVN